MRNNAVIAALLGLATPAWAQTDAGQPQAAAATAVAGVKVTAGKDPEAIVCVHHDPAGTRIPGPTECHPRRVWDQLTEAARQETQDVQQRSFFRKNNQ
jgi:hypothetical protein